MNVQDFNVPVPFALINVPCENEISKNPFHNKTLNEK
jgi:hypothetical protein